MALLNKIRKDIKKSSYYVWFLGAQESKGLRGQEYITPVLRSLIQRERTVEPFKITLQISHKGLKIIQNLNTLNTKPFANKADLKPEPKPNKNDVIKHFIPHHAVTCVLQEDDVVACILLLYNPVTRCPVHVHGYRCDSIETASLLTQQLTTLIERPDNQKKLNEIEGRLRAKGLLLPTVPRVNIPKRLNSSGSDGRSTTSPASESSGGSSGGCQNERITNLYDSLAAELREKLGMGTDKAMHAPILLPPRDYDTVHRQKGNLTGIEMRRCLNENIVGVKTKSEVHKETEKKGTKGGPLKRVLGSSGGSSGIGSDHPPSPDQNGRYLDNQSTSDEEWAEHPSEDSLFLVTQEGHNNSSSWRNTPDQMSLPRAKRLGSNRLESPTEVHREQNDSPNRTDSGFQRSEENLLRKRSSSPKAHKKDGSVISKRSGSPHHDYLRKSEENLIAKRSVSPLRNPNHKSSPNLARDNRNPSPLQYRRSQSPGGRYRKELDDEPRRKITPTKNVDEYVKDKIPIENFRKRNEKGNMSPVGIVAPRRRTSEDNRKQIEDKYWEDDDAYKRRIPGYKEKMKQMEENYDKNEEYNQKAKRNDENRKMLLKEKKAKENTMKLSPQERFLDAKTKFLMLEQERLKEQEKNLQNLEKKRSIQEEAPISPEIIKNRPSWNRNEESKQNKNDKPALVRRNSFFDNDQRDIKYYDKEPRGKSVDHSRDIIAEHDGRIRRLSRSDSQNRFFSQERLNGDIDYDIRYTNDAKNYREERESPRRRRISREEVGYTEEHRRYSRSDYNGERERRRYPSPKREAHRYSSPDNRRHPPSDEERFIEDEKYRYELRKRYEREPRPYSNGRETPPRSRYEEEEEMMRRRRYEDENELSIPLDRYKSPIRRNKSISRDESSPKIVPYEKNKKSKYEIMENEKKINSNALAKEFKRRSYQEKIEVDKRLSYGDRDYDDRYRNGYHDEYPEKVEVQRRNQYNMGDADFKRNSHELAKEFNRRSRGYSYDEEDESRRRRSGYQELNDRERYPGLDRETARISHHQIDERYPDPRLSRLSPEEHDRFIESPRMTHLQVEKMPARYRHSFVESTPSLSIMAPTRGHEMLHRTNSSVSSNRVGIAAVHPY